MWDEWRQAAGYGRSLGYGDGTFSRLVALVEATDVCHWLRLRLRQLATVTAKSLADATARFGHFFVPLGYFDVMCTNRFIYLVHTLFFFYVEYVMT